MTLTIVINSLSNYNGEIHFQNLLGSNMWTSSLSWLALFMDGWMLENLMDEIMLVFSTIVQLWFDFKFNLIATFLQLCCDYFPTLVILEPFNIEVNNFHYIAPCH
jgi:hypothetical protein